VSTGTAPRGPAAVRAPALPGCLMVLGICALSVAVGAIIALIRLPEGRASTLAARAAVALVAATSLVAAEALWYRRRWVFPATVAMLLSVIAWPMALEGAEIWGALKYNLSWVALIGGFAIALLVYVYMEARRMFAASRAAAAPGNAGAGTP
jgi:hypothetical protein